jgi:RNA polymerase sigma factor (sigma-70 family)
MNSETEHKLNNLLVQRYQNGEDDALKHLIVRFQPVMIRTIYYHTSNRDAVEDISQDCWYDIIARLKELKLKISFNAWALTIVRRKCIDWIRDQQRERKQAQLLNLEVEADAAEQKTGVRLEQIQIGIQQLLPTQRIVLTMFYLENLSLEEISDVLDISKGTVKSRLFYARENLKKILIKQHGDK